jgi:hypothetical protein
MYLQSQPGFFAIQEFDGGAAHQPGSLITLQHVEAVLRRVSNTDVTVRALHTVTTWTDRARQATTYRKGRTFLAGDAAHIHAPLGGQGLNLGLGDAMNLGWKLAAVVHGQAPDDLLDTYMSERHPVGVKVLEWSRAQAAVMKPGPQGAALQSVVRDLMNTHDGATYMAGRIWGIHLKYDLGSDHPLVGMSVPNFRFEDGTTANQHLRDGRGLLLDFGSSPQLQSTIGKYASGLKYISAKAEEQLGLTLALIRPDGVIALASTGDIDSDLLVSEIKRWFLYRK